VINTLQHWGRALADAVGGSEADWEDQGKKERSGHSENVVRLLISSNLLLVCNVLLVSIDSALCVAEGPGLAGRYLGLTSRLSDRDFYSKGSRENKNV